MATCNFIRETKQNESSMRAVIRYVSQDAKTVDKNGRRYLSGVNCMGESAFDEFMATKNLFGKCKGTYFYHYEQSFRPGEIAFYDEAHLIGTELAARMFAGYEVLVGTHLDAESDGAERVHNHFVINSVSFENGKKLQLGTHSLEQMRKISDEICRAYSLSVLPEYKQSFGTKAINTREYRSALRGESWKFKCINNIEKAMTMAGTKQDFIAIMESVGYGVTWTESRKHITYTCPNGMKVRDKSLHETKFLKENMEYEFTIREQAHGKHSAFEAEAMHGNSDKDGGGNALPPDSVCDSREDMGGFLQIYESLGGIPAEYVREIRGAGGESDNAGGPYADVGDNRGMVGQAEPRCENLGGQYSTESAGSACREQGNAFTGWEEARAIFLEAEHRDGELYGGILGSDLRDEALDNWGDSRLGGAFGAHGGADLSADEISGFFPDEATLYDDMPFDGDEQENGTSIYRLKEQARLGNVYAMYRLSRVYFDKNNGHYNEALGEIYLTKAAEKGYSAAQYRTGKMFLYGIVYREDELEAEKWLSEAAQSGSTSADALLGKLYVESDLFGESRGKGFRHLFRAESAGSEFAAYTLGKYYMEGKLVKKDIAKAIEHLELASARGNMYADYRLAQAYLFEADIFDIEKAIEYLNRSAQAGCEPAAVALARMAQNAALAVATDILDIVAGLANIESYRVPEDCTTMPKTQKKRKQLEQTL